MNENGNQKHGKRQTERWNRKKIGLLYGIIVLAILISSFWKIYQINAAFPPAETVYVELGTEDQMEEDFMVQVESMELLDRQQLEERYGNYIVLSDEYDYKGVIAKVIVRNVCEETKTFESYQFYIETERYFTDGLDRDLYLLENQDGFVLEMKEGEKRIVYLTYSMREDRFSEQNWEEIEEERFYLIEKRYPRKIYWRLS